MRRTRWHTRAVFCLILGLVTNFILAIVLAVATTSHDFSRADHYGERLTDPRGGPASESNGKAPPDTQYMELSVYTAPGVSFGMSRLRPFQNYTPAAPPLIHPTPESAASRWERAELLPWLDGHSPWPDPKKGDNVWVKASGWPLRSFVCNPSAKNAVGFGSHTWTARGGIIIGNPVRASWADWPPMIPPLIPLRPLWPELLINSALYAAAWAGLTFGLTALRRALRTRRGHCARCNYSLEGLSAGGPCPECGHATASGPSPQPS